MKFNDGYWMMRPGVVPHYATEIIGITHDKNQAELLVSTKGVQHRGDSLNTALLSISYQMVMENVLKVRIVHHKGGRKRGPEFGIQTSGLPLEVSENPAEVHIGHGSLKAVIQRENGFSVSYRHDDRELTNSAWRNTAWISDYESLNRMPGSEQPGQESTSYMVEQLHISPGEYIYGMGERFTPLVRNGQSTEIWNEDPGTASEQSYKNIPFYLSSQGYGVFVRHSGRVSFETASEKVSRASFSVPGQELEYYIIAGPTPREVLSRYTALTGRPPLPPAWSFGLWLSTSFTTDYDEACVNSFLDGMQQRQIPVSVFHFDCFWMKGWHWVDFRWDPEVFPDPKAMIERLHQRGLKICLWINPYIAQQSALFDSAAESGFLLKKPNGDIWQTDLWQAGMAIVDFTNPQAREWYQKQLRNLLDIGVDCFKTDFGERIPVDVCYYDGSDPQRMHNYYSYLYNEAVYSLLQEARGPEEAVVFARSATSGCQQFPVHWGGDSLANYDSMAESLRGGLSLCLSGFAFWSHDIGGFEQTATADLYKRWAAFGLLSTHSRLHGSTSYRVPWLFDDEASEVLHFFTDLKLKLMPWLYSRARDSVEAGLPLMRHMLLEFPQDPGVKHLDMQYMLGPDLLVAPVFNPEGRVEWYLPDGSWVNILDGTRYKGPGWKSAEFDYFSLPLLAREGAIIPMGNKPQSAVYDYTDRCTVHIYNPNGNNQIEIVDSAGNPAAEVSCQHTKEGLAISWTGLKNPDFCVYIENPERLSADPDCALEMKTSNIPGSAAVLQLKPKTDSEKGRILLRIN